MAKKQEEGFRLRQGYFFDDVKDQPQPDQQEERRPAQRRSAASRGQQRKIQPRVYIIAAAVVCLIAAGVIFGPQLLSGGGAAASWSIADLVGEWQCVENGQLAFTATVDMNGITVRWASEDGTTALFWKGSFLVPAGPQAKKTVVSNGAVEEMQYALLASRETQKTFTVTRNTIEYEVTALGVSKMATLRRK